MGLDLKNMLGTPSSGGVPANAVVEIDVNNLVPYHNHKFTLYEGDRLNDMVESIKNNGILLPLIVRPADEKGKYEILSGHNRCNAAKLANLSVVPCVVKENLTNDEAEMYVIETNVLQRGFNDLKISEQAEVLALRHSKMFNKAKVSEIKDELANLQNCAVSEDSGDKVYVAVNGKSKLAAVGTEYGLSKNSVARLIRVSKLTEELKQSIDLSLMPVRAGVELSYLPRTAQKAIFEYYKETAILNDKEYQAVRIDMKLSESLRELFEGFDGTEKAATKMLDSYTKGLKDKPKKPKSHKLSADIYSKYFDDDKTDEYINNVIDEALQMYFDSFKETDK